MTAARKPRGPGAVQNMGPAGHNVADSLRALRDIKGWTLAKVAEQMCAAGFPLNGSKVCRHERGLAGIDIDRLAAYASIYGVSADDLIRAEPVKQAARMRLTELRARVAELEAEVSA